MRAPCAMARPGAQGPVFSPFLDASLSPGLHLQHQQQHQSREQQWCEPTGPGSFSRCSGAPGPWNGEHCGHCVLVSPEHGAGPLHIQDFASCILCSMCYSPSSPSSELRGPARRPRAPGCCFPPVQVHPMQCAELWAGCLWHTLLGRG